MAKIKVEVEVPNGEYCDKTGDICPMCYEGDWGEYYCLLFGGELEIDDNNYYCIRCDKCKQAEARNDK